MKRVILLCVSLILLIIPTGCANQSSSLGTYNNYTLGTSFPSVPDQLPVYQVLNKTVDEKYIIDLKSKFGDEISEESEIDYNSPIILLTSMESEATLLVFSQSGAITYGYKSREKLDPSSTPNLPNDDQAKEIAVKFLKDHQLLTSDVHVQDEVVIGGAGEDGEPAHLLVRFTYSIGGLPVTGLGDKFSVRIGDNGEIVQAMIHHVEYAPLNQTQIKTPSQAFEDLKNQNTIGTNMEIQSHDVLGGPHR